MRILFSNERGKPKSLRSRCGTVLMTGDAVVAYSRMINLGQRKNHGAMEEAIVSPAKCPGSSK
jgi:hypothetical protein